MRIEWAKFDESIWRCACYIADYSIGVLFLYAIKFSPF